MLSARRRISRFVRRTPLIQSSWLSRLAHADVHLKLETLQVTNSFKIRGACNALLCLLEERRSPDSDRRHSRSESESVVTASAGNHGRAVACAAEALGVRATIFTPAAAPETKLSAIRRHGADLRAIATDYDEAEQLAKEFARSEGAVFISAYNDRDVIAGAGTIALEIMEDLPAVNAVVCPLGGGGLLSGIATTLRQLNPSCRSVGAEASASPPFHTSLAAGHITTINVRPTIADGLAGNLDPEAMTFDIVRRTIDHVELVSEEELAEGIRGLLSEEHLIAEGAGVAGVAAVIAGRLQLERRTVAVILSGANIDAAKLSALLTGR